MTPGKVHEYASCTTFSTTSEYMEGHYTFHRLKNKEEVFDVAIPRFHMVCPPFRESMVHSVCSPFFSFFLSNPNNNIFLILLLLFPMALNLNVKSLRSAPMRTVVKMFLKCFSVSVLLVTCLSVLSYQLDLYRCMYIERGPEDTPIRPLSTSTCLS